MYAASSLSPLLPTQSMSTNMLGYVVMSMCAANISACPRDTEVHGTRRQHQPMCGDGIALHQERAAGCARRSGRSPPEASRRGRRGRARRTHQLFALPFTAQPCTPQPSTQEKRTPRGHPIMLRLVKLGACGTQACVDRKGSMMSENGRTG